MSFSLVDLAFLNFEINSTILSFSPIIGLANATEQAVVVLQIMVIVNYVHYVLVFGSRNIKYKATKQ